MSKDDRSLEERDFSVALRQALRRVIVADLVREGMTQQARERQEELDAQLATRAEYLTRARTYGPVNTANGYPPPHDGPRRISQFSRKYTLLFTAPANVTPAWQAVLDEAHVVFAELLTASGLT